MFLVPFFQARYGNGGIGVVLSFAVGELVSIATAIRLLPRGVLTRGIAADVLRAAVAGVGTLAIGVALPQLSPVIGIPACIALFSFLAVGVGLVTRADIATLVGVARRRHSARGEAAALTS
jgi:hypothetical protein